MRLFKKRRWVDTIVPVVPLDKALRDYIGTTLIDFSTLDIEGAEFPIRDALKYGGELANADVIFCQVVTHCR
jgi:hypothetical protein